MNTQDDAADTPTPSRGVLRISAWVLAGAFFIAYSCNHPWLFVAPSSVLDGTYLWIALGLYLFPFLRSLKLGKFLELERELDRTKENLITFKEDVRQQVSFLSANVTAVSTNLNTTFNNYVYSGEERNPPPSAPEPSSVREPVAHVWNSASWNSASGRELAPPWDQPTAIKILNTLWIKQVNKFSDVLPRFTFKIAWSARTPEAVSYPNAVKSLTAAGLIAQTPDQQCYLTEAGLRFCLDHYQTFPADIWFNQEMLDPEKLAKVVAKIRAG